MHIDDRLATVLNARADGAAALRAQWRQLVDLLGTMPVDADGPHLDTAYQRLAQIGRSVPVTDRAAILATPGLRLRSPRLIAALASENALIARAAVQQARLDEEQWLDLIPALSMGARAALRERTDTGSAIHNLLGRLGAGAPALSASPPTSALAPADPSVDQPTTTAAANTSQPSHVPASSEISALLQRIETYRRARTDDSPAPLSGEAPRLPLGDSIASPRASLGAFDFATDSQGRVIWADPGVAPMVVGMLIPSATGSAESDLAADGLVRAWRRRQQISGASLTIAGAAAISGIWQLDCAPEFDPLTGAFTGYNGRLRRPASQESQPAPQDSEADRVRQMLHELRTPANAIQGFAEVIQQQLFGPTPHAYRALAAAIAGDAARILAGFEELERMARLRSGAAMPESGEADLAAAIRAVVSQLEPHVQSRNGAIVIQGDTAPLMIRLAQGEIERMVWRLLATLVGSAAPGETLTISIARDETGNPQCTFGLPAALAARDDAALFDTGPGAVSQTVAAGLFGVGFSLRLARAEAQAGGGSLQRKDDTLCLTLPGLTIADPAHSHKTVKPERLNAVV